MVLVYAYLAHMVLLYIRELFGTRFVEHTNSGDCLIALPAFQHKNSFLDLKSIP